MPPNSAPDAFSAITVLLRQFFLPYVIGLAVALFAIPLMRSLAIRREWYDRPDSGLKPHEKPIPYLGGVGLWIGWLAVLSYAYTRPDADRASLSWLAAGGSILMAIGLIDDLRGLSPKLRLLVQALVAGGLIYSGVGVGVWRALTAPLEGSLPLWLTQDLTAWWVDTVFCVFLLAGASNATNLIDGLDGLCGGIIGIACLGFWALTLLLWQSGSAGEADAALGLRVALCAGLVGVCTAFLAYNFNPAIIFMGDSGSLLLGFNVAVLIDLLVRQGSWRGLVGGLLIFGLPILDTTLAVVRRRLNGRPLFRGDRSHLYDQLRDRGCSVRKTVYICYALGGAFMVLGCACALLPAVWVAVLALGTPVVGAVACLRLGLLRVDDTAEKSHAL